MTSRLSNRSTFVKRRRSGVRQAWYRRPMRESGWHFCRRYRIGEVPVAIERHGDREAPRKRRHNGSRMTSSKVRIRPPN